MDEEQLQRGRGRQDLLPDLKLAELKVIELSHGTQGVGCERVEVGGWKEEHQDSLESTGCLRLDLTKYTIKHLLVRLALSRK